MYNLFVYRKYIVLIGVLLLSTMNVDLIAQDSLAKRYTTAVEAFDASDYQQAVKIYQATIEREGWDSATLYNLAVSYRKLGDLSQAILWLERAMLLEPTSSQIRLTLSDAYAATKDVQAEVVQAPVSMFDGLAYSVSLPVWGGFALFSLLISSVGFFIFRQMPTLVWRKRIFYLSLVCMGACLFFNAQVAHQVYYHQKREERMILLHSVALRDKPNEDAKPVGKLNEGTAVRFLVSEGEWHRVKTSYGHEGWLLDDVAEFVKPQDK